MKYKIITSGNHGELNTKIEELIKEGWKPFGSHQMSLYGTAPYALHYSQGMIKEDVITGDVSEATLLLYDLLEQIDDGKPVFVPILRKNIKEILGKLKNPS